MNTDNKNKDKMSFLPNNVAFGQHSQKSQKLLS